MPIARKHQISLSDTPFYHCISRCVRRAFLCGEDGYTGKSYEHRKQWVADKLSQLAHVFAIDVCSYAIMSNHFHGVLMINHAKADSWSMDEVIERWTLLFSGGVLIQRYKIGQCKTQAEINKVKELADTWRERLMDISWFMRCLNESIARQANAEDKCTGRFWEGRFKCQALLDEQALLACMTYVDLNPVRAGICNTLEDSEFTSIAQRLAAFSIKSTIPKSPENRPLSLKPRFSSDTPPPTSIPLADFVAGSQTRQGIPYALNDYFELVDWTGRAIRNDKRGYIPKSEPEILHKLGIGTEIWLETVGNFTHHFHTYVGPEEKLKTICQQQQKKWLTGIKICRRLFTGTNPLIT
jgi:REP element-mobilizing transposase RayT